MKNSTLFLLFFISSTFLFSQEWVRQNPFPIESDLNAIHMGADGNGWAVGDNGAIVATQNFGDNWTLQSSDYLSTNLNCVSYDESSAGMIAYIGGNGNVLLKTEDGGTTWTEASESFADGNIIEIECLDNDVLLVGSNTLNRSTDGGSTFTPSASYTGSGVKAMDFYDNDLGIVIGASGFVWRTTDGGLTWNDVYDLQTSIVNVAFSTSDIVYAEANRSFYKSIDGGQTWNLEQADVFNFFVAGIAASSTGRLFASYKNSVRLGKLSLDGGQTWEEINSPLPQDDNLSVFGLPDGRIWMPGENARIVTFDENIQNWIDQISDKKELIRAIDFYDENLGVVGGEHGFILRTTDGGLIWERSQLPAGSENVRISGVHYYDENHVYLAGGAGIYLSEDQGASWTKVITQGGISVHARTPDEIFLGSGNGRIVYTSDGGSTNTTVHDFGQENNPQIRTMFFTDNGVAYAGGFRGIYAKTTDGGQSWVETIYPVDHKIEEIHFLNENEGFFTKDGFNDTLFHTIDGGISWDSILLPVRTGYTGIDFMNDQVGWMSGGDASKGVVLKTVDGGQSWEVALQIQNSLRGISAPHSSEEIVWAAGAGGSIMNIMPCEGMPLLTDLSGEMSPCLGDTVEYVVSGTDVSLFEWTLPEGWNIIGNTTSALIQVIAGESAGAVSVQGNNTCEFSNQLAIDVMSFTAPETPEITFNGNLLNCSVTGDVYVWFLNGDFVAETTSASYAPEESGNYTVAVRISHCFSTRSEFVAVVLVGVEDAGGDQINVYPNPAQANIFIENNGAPIHEITLVDLNGREIEKWSTTYGTVGHGLNIASVRPGIYLLRFQTNDYIINTKLMIQR